MHNAWAPGLIVLALVLAGCTGSDPGAGTASEAAPLADNDELGSLHGRVLDDESVPIGGAEVRLMPDDVSAQTDPQGIFRFSRLEPGPRTLVANKTGYNGAELRAEVVAGQVQSTRLILTPLPVLDPYTSVLSGTLYLHVAYKDVHRHAALDGVSCSPCEYWWRTQPGVSDGAIEVIWTPSVTLPMVNEAFRFGLSVNAWNGTYHGTAWIADGDPVWSGVLKSRGKYAFEPHDARKFPQNETVTMVHANTPDEVSFGLAQRINVWLTLAYDMTLPEEYSILPSV